MWRGVHVGPRSRAQLYECSIQAPLEDECWDGTDPAAVSVRGPDSPLRERDPMSILNSLRPRKASGRRAGGARCVARGGHGDRSPRRADRKRGPLRHRRACLPDPAGQSHLLRLRREPAVRCANRDLRPGHTELRVGRQRHFAGSGVDFFAFDRNTGAQVGFVPGRPAQYYTTRAGSNCVVNENGPFLFTLPPGNYRIVANYFPGNYFRLVSDVVANLDVLPAPPPPPPPVCFFDPNQGNVVCI